MDNHVIIKKAKIKDDLFLDVEFTEELPGHSKKDTKLSCTVPVHNDLKDAMQLLHKHLAIICDEVKTPTRNKFTDEAYASFFVRGFSIGGNDEHEGVSISGFKEGKYGVVNLNTPFKKFTDEDYPFTYELSIHIQAVVHEVIEYLFNGKKAPDQQLSLEFGESADELVETAN